MHVEKFFSEIIGYIGYIRYDVDFIDFFCPNVGKVHRVHRAQMIGYIRKKAPDCSGASCLWSAVNVFSVVPCPYSVFLPSKVSHDPANLDLRCLVLPVFGYL